MHGVSNSYLGGMKVVTSSVIDMGTPVVVSLVGYNPTSLVISKPAH
jgi:hypothetical protein